MLKKVYEHFIAATRYLPKTLVLEIDISSEALMEKKLLMPMVKPDLYKRDTYLCYTINEAYELFCIDYPYIKLGRTSFYSCKPDHAMLRSETPANSCLCIYHENMRLLITSPNCFPDLKDFISIIVCDSKRRECMLQTCISCGNLKVCQETRQNKLKEDD